MGWFRSRVGEVIPGQGMPAAVNRFAPAAWLSSQRQEPHQNANKGRYFRSERCSTDGAKFNPMRGRNETSRGQKPGAHFYSFFSLATQQTRPFELQLYQYPGKFKNVWHIFVSLQKKSCFAQEGRGGYLPPRQRHFLIQLHELKSQLRGHARNEQGKPHKASLYASERGRENKTVQRWHFPSTGPAVHHRHHVHTHTTLGLCSSSRKGFSSTLAASLDLLFLFYPYQYHHYTYDPKER